MPKAFKKCIKAGGRVITKRMGDGQYIRICYKDGKSYPGEVKVRKKAK